MPVIREGKYITDVLHYEEDQRYSRETVILPKGHATDIGTVLGRIKDSNQYSAIDLQATNGLKVAVAVSLTKVDANDGDAEILAIIRHAIVKPNGLVWPSITDKQIQTAIQQLEAVGILVRD